LLELRAVGRSSISIGVALKRSFKAVNGRLALLRARQREGAAPAATRFEEPSRERGIL
jgi:hypothetical protein